MSGPRTRLSSEDIGDVIEGWVTDRQRFRLIDVAAEFGVSRRTLQRAMTADGDTFASRHKQSRLYVAAHELVLKRGSVRRAGELAGFATTSYFCVAFKAYFGVTPGTVRAAAVAQESSRTAIAEADAMSSSMTLDGIELFEELMEERAALRTPALAPRRSTHAELEMNG